MDVRSLALLRVAIGVLLFLDVLIRSVYFRAHYSAEGILPLKFYLSQPDLTFRFWSVFYLNDSPLYVLLLFALAGVASLCLALGYRTRLAGWVCWVFLLGLHHRNPLVLHKGDAYLLLILFWGCLLPWGQALSVDALNGESKPPETDLSVAGVGYLAQVCFLYWFSAVYRTHPIWCVDGSALYYSFHLESDLTWLAPKLLPLEPALAFFSHATLYLEAFGPFLLLVPLKRVRALAVVLIISFHAGILSSLNLGLFAWICMAAPLGLLPTWAWDNRFGRGIEKWLAGGIARAAERLPRPATVPSKGPMMAIVVPAVAIFAMTYYSFSDLYGRDMDSSEMNLIRVTGLDQKWGMFSPRPPGTFGWQSAPATTVSGKQLELFPKRAKVLQQRWRFYRSNLLNGGFGPHCRSYLNYLVGRWNQANPEDPILSAQYILETRTIEPHYQLGVFRRAVKAEYHQ